MTTWRHPDAWEGSHVSCTMCQQQLAVARLQEYSHTHIHPTLHYLRREVASYLLIKVVDRTEWWMLGKVLNIYKEII